MKTSIFSEEPIIGILRQIDGGLSIAEASRQHGFIESFNDKFRDECLDRHWLDIAVVDGDRLDRSSMSPASFQATGRTAV